VRKPALKQVAAYGLCEIGQQHQNQFSGTRAANGGNKYLKLVWSGQADVVRMPRQPGEYFQPSRIAVRLGIRAHVEFTSPAANLQYIHSTNVGITVDAHQPQ